MVMKIDFSFYLAVLLAIFSRQVDVYLTYIIAILVHELGHLVFANIFKWKLESFRLTAIGGFLSFENDLIQPLRQIFLVNLGGVIFNCIFIIILRWVNGPASLIHTQLAIIIFNLLPIAPLDGSKILQGILNKVVGYKKTLSILKVLNMIFLFIFALAVGSLRLEQYFIAVVVLAVLVGKFQGHAPYMYERYKILKGLHPSPSS